MSLWPRPRPVLAWSAAVGIALAVLMVRGLLTPWLGEQAPYLVLLLAPVLAAAWLGLGPGVLATVVALVGGQILFISPLGSAIPPDLAEWLRAAIFTIQGIFVVWLIDSRRSALLEVASREQRLALTIEAGAMGAWEFDPATQRSRFNAAQFELLGMSSSADGTVPSNEFFDRVHPDDRPALTASIERVAATGGVFSGEFRVVPRAGEERWLAGRGRFVDTPGGGPRIMIGLNWDITERRRREEDLARLTAALEQRVAERTQELTAANAELEAFAYTVAHDLRAPLRNMSTLAEAVLEDVGPSLPSEQRDYLHRIVRAATRLDGMIQDLLAYSRIGREDAPTTRVDLRTAVENLLEQLGDQGRAVGVEGAHVVVNAHARTLHQVLQNLITNALKFVGAGRAPDVVVRVSRAAGRARVEVRDQGIGIEAQHHERIFRVFERLHGQESYAGTGIGLAIVKKGIERMGGRVGVESAPGAGSTFWFELPEAQTE